MSYPPQEIIDQMKEGRDFDWDVIEVIETDDRLTKKLRCGCEFSNGVKTFSYSNKFCSKHAPRHEFSHPIDQTVDKK